MLNLACEKENAVREATNSVSLIGKIVHFKHKSFIRLGGKLCAEFMKNSISDATFSYLGKIDCGEEVNKHIKNYMFVSWTDFGYCNIAASDFEGEFTMMITEAYEDRRIIPQFIGMAKDLGLGIHEVDSFMYFNDGKQKEN